MSNVRSDYCKVQIRLFQPHAMQDRKVSKKLVTFLTRFASGEELDARWRPVEVKVKGDGEKEAEVKYAVIDGSPLRMAMDQQFKEVGDE